METLLLFPEQEKKKRRLQVYSEPVLRDNMGLVTMHTELFDYECVPSMSVIQRLPSCDIEQTIREGCTASLLLAITHVAGRQLGVSR